MHLRFDGTTESNHTTDYLECSIEIAQNIGLVLRYYADSATLLADIAHDPKNKMPFGTTKVFSWLDAATLVIFIRVEEAHAVSRTRLWLFDEVRIIGPPSID